MGVKAGAEMAHGVEGGRRSGRGSSATIFTALGASLILGAVALSVVFVVPSPIDAAGWSPPPRPEQTGPLAPNDELSWRGRG